MTSLKAWWLWCVLAWVALAPTDAWAGKLEGIRSEVRGGSSSSSSSSSSRGRSRGGGSSSDDDDVSGGVGLMLLGALLSGGDSNCCESSPPRKSRPPAPRTFGRYARFPYRNGHGGYLMRVKESDDDLPGRIYGGRLSVEGAYMGDNVWRSGFDIDLSVWRLSLLSDMGFYLEQPLIDALYLGSTHAAFTLVMRPRVQWRVGGGVNYMADGRTPGQGHREYASGGGGTTRLDIYPVWPVVLSGRFDYGKIYKAPTVTARGTVGLTIRGFELYGGYEFRSVGKVTMQGPVLGIRAWF